MWTVLRLEMNCSSFNKISPESARRDLLLSNGRGKMLRSSTRISGLKLMIPHPLLPLPPTTGDETASLQPLRDPQEERCAWLTAEGASLGRVAGTGFEPQKPIRILRPQSFFASMSSGTRTSRSASRAVPKASRSSFRMSRGGTAERRSRTDSDGSCGNCQ